jgi:hypothetical protein
MSIRRDFVPFRELGFLLAVAIVMALILAGAGILYLAQPN